MKEIPSLSEQMANYESDFIDALFDFSDKTKTTSSGTDKPIEINEDETPF